jgi:hypothetical protein
MYSARCESNGEVAYHTSKAYVLNSALCKSAMYWNVFRVRVYKNIFCSAAQGTLLRKRLKKVFVYDE